MTEECFDILTYKQQLVKPWNDLLASAIIAETKIRNEIEKKPNMNLNDLKTTVLTECTELGIRGYIEKKKKSRILGGSVWTSLAIMFDHQNKYPEERVEYSGTRQFKEVTLQGGECCEWPGCLIQNKLQKDHIIPKSVLTDGLKRRGGADWLQNGQRLCPFHNRLKTDSIMIGVLMVRC